jgi:hypothetical protein
MSKKLPRGTLDRLWSDPANWPLAGLYYCKGDPRIIVPKRNPRFGWTMNFAHTSTWVALLLLVVSVIVPIMYLKSLNTAAAIGLLGVWVVLLLIICGRMSSTSRHED